MCKKDHVEDMTPIRGPDLYVLDSIMKAVMPVLKEKKDYEAIWSLVRIMSVVSQRYVNEYGEEKFLEALTFI